jgi:hypothetical protein
VSAGLFEAGFSAAEFARRGILLGIHKDALTMAGYDEMRPIIREDD